MTASQLAYLGARLARAALTVLGIVTLVFLLVRIVPGDPVDAILGDQASPEDRAALRAALQLDRPFAAQYGAFLAHVANGTLGTSFRQPDRTVASMVLEVVPETLTLGALAVAIAWLAGVPLGLLAAVRRGTPVDRGAMTFAVLGVAIPHIWLGPLLILLFGVELRWLPMPGDDPHALAGMVLPALTVGSALAATMSRQARAAFIEVLSEQYILAARARGVGSAALFFRHALRNALLPLLTIGGAQLGAVLSGTVVAEKIFERPGLGTLFLDAFFARDIPVVQGCVLVIASIYVLVNLAVDVTYSVVDPRVALG